MGPLGYFLIGWCLYQLKAPLVVCCIFYFSMGWNLLKWVVED